MIAFTTLAVALSVLPSAFAQKQYTVQVGAGGQLKYDPESITGINPGDLIDFVFNPKNHTVTQSSFAFPCQAVDNAIRSGFVPVAAGASPITKRLIAPASVSSGPLWFYCGQTGHCGQGMVFALNPPASGNTFDAFKAKAIADFGAGATAVPTFTTPPPPAFSTATTVVSSGTSTWTTTYTSYVGSTVTPVPAANPVDHKITVGANGQLAFSPANITANIGDTVTFEFHPKNHTVTQSSFANPCVRLSGADNVQGFASGFRPVASDDGDLPTFQIKVNDTAPIWGYCGQTGHCARGMVFAINAIESGPNNFATFQQLATQQNGDAPNAGGDFSATSTTPAGPGNTNTPGGGNNTGAASVSKGMSGALVFGAIVMGIVGFAL